MNTMKGLVPQVLAAPVNQDYQPSDEEYEDQLLVAFHLDDGTTSIRAFGVGTGHLYRGIMTPETR